MNTVNLRISGLQNASDVEVFVDGEAVAGKKNQFGSYEVRYQTEKQNVEIALRNNSELDGRFWWFFRFDILFGKRFRHFQSPLRQSAVSRLPF